MSEAQTENKLIRASKLIASGNFDALGQGASRSLKRAVGKLRGQPEEVKPAAATPWFHKQYLRELTDLGDLLGSDYAGIYSPGYTDATVNKYLHEQFRSGAENHAERYEYFDNYEKLLRSELANLAIEDGQELTVLDIGSGAGNTVVPLLKILSNVRLIASELSPEMLRVLKGNLSELQLLDRCSLLQLNAEHLAFEPDTFDLVTGGGILHHLFYPHATINHCYKILKPGGSAIFFEPMKSGNRILQLMFETMMETCFDEIPEAHRNYLMELLVNLDNQHVWNKENPIFQAVDDKWMFSRWKLCTWAKDAGFKKIEIKAMYGREAMLEKQARHIFEEYAGLSYDLLPESARSLVRQMEENLPEKLKSSMLIEAAVVLTKSLQDR